MIMKVSKAQIQIGGFVFQFLSILFLSLVIEFICRGLETKDIVLKWIFISLFTAFIWSCFLPVSFKKREKQNEKSIVFFKANLKGLIIISIVFFLSSILLQLIILKDNSVISWLLNLGVALFCSVISLFTNKDENTNSTILLEFVLFFFLLIVFRFLIKETITWNVILYGFVNAIVWIGFEVRCFKKTLELSPPSRNELDN